MKKNRYILLLVAVLAIIALVLILTTNTTTFRRPQSDFAVDDTSNVTMIFMADKNNNTLKMRKTGPGEWQINDKYRGHKYNIEMLLGTILNLQVKEPVAKSAQRTIMKLMSAGSVKVEIYQRVYRIDLFGVQWFPHEKRTKVYYVGSSTPDNRGTYMLMENSSQPFITFLPGLRGFVASRYMPIEKYWRDYTIFKKGLREIASLKVEFPLAPAGSFELINHPGEAPEMIALSDGRHVANYDTIKVMNLLNSFRSVNFETFITGIDAAKKDSILRSTPFHIITLTDTLGKKYEAKTFRRAALPGSTDMDGKPVDWDLDRMYALVNGGQDFVLVQFFVFDRLLRPMQFYLPSGPVTRGKK
jgi:hypothetical protein